MQNSMYRDMTYCYITIYTVKQIMGNFKELGFNQ